jgi:hypothetical protein
MMRTVVAGGTVVCPVATAEDILLAKPQWFQTGGEVSEPPWSDSLGVASLLARAVAQG